MRTRHLAILILSVALCGALSCQSTWTPPPKVVEKPVFSEIGDHILPDKRLVEMTCEVSISHIPAKIKKVLVWIPYPATSSVQGPVEPVIESPFSFRPRIGYDGRYQQPYLLISAESDAAGVVKDFSVTYTMQVERMRLEAHMLVAAPDNAAGPYGMSGTPVTAAAPETDNAFRERLAADLAPVSGLTADNLAGVLAKVPAADNTPTGRARAVYDFVMGALDPDNSASMKPNAVLDVLAAKKGTSLDYAVVTCALMRAAGIPARVESGICLGEEKTPDSTEVPRRSAWVAFYAKGLGWTTCDPYLADRFPELKDYLFNGVDANRIQLGTGPEPGLVPPPGAGLPLVLADVVAEADGKPVAATVKITFHDVCGCQ